MSLEQSRMELERRQRMTVKRGYLTGADGTKPVLVGSDGWFFDPASWDWAVPGNAQAVTTVGAAYHTWSDVPFAWINGCPYWK